MRSFFLRTGVAWYVEEITRSIEFLIFFTTHTHTHTQALCDWLTRRFAQTCKEIGVDQSLGDGRGNWNSAKGGALRMYSPGTLVH